MFLPVPVSKSHHDIQSGKEQHEVKEGIAVLNSFLLIVCNTADYFFSSSTTCPHTIFQDGTITSRQSQLAHLAVTGRADAASDPKQKLLKNCI